MRDSYDFIIVGGGSAGCVLAARLSQDPDVQVLLIEAGGSDRNVLFHLPAGFATMTKGIAAWGWQTIPQRNMKDRIFNYTQAKVIGGGSSINAQIYTRGHPNDYDEWKRMGCTGWGYDEVLPYFCKAEDNDSFDAPYHGTGGPLGVSQPVAPLPICEAYFDAAATMGIPRNMDVNGACQDGTAYYQLTQRKARRSSAAMAYLAPVRQRANLTCLLNTQVRKISVIAGRAQGVKLMDGKQFTARAEVLLCSGAIGSPRLLQLSGIGPADHLTKIGIDVMLDQPEVGSNLQDHLDLYCICEVSGNHTYDRYAKPVHSARALVQYVLTRRGPVASSLFETGGFWYADPQARSPDLQLHLGLGTGIEKGVAAMPNGGVTLNSCYLRPRSRGSVRLASADPNIAPLIDPNYLDDPWDRAMSVRGLKLTQEILAQKPLEPFIKVEHLPGPDVHTDAEYFDFICAHSKTSHHCAGTCRMGVDQDAVVDPRLRFNGIEKLRVVDNAIMPKLISSNTNAAAMMIGEKAADMICVDHGIHGP